MIRKTPLVLLERVLHTPVTYLILPIFAFANAGVNLSGISPDVIFTERVAAGIVFGLFVGKPIGIFLACRLAVRMRICEMPPNCNWPVLIGIAFMCGIGFTVSLFIGNLAYLGVASDYLVNLVKIGVFAGSAMSGLAGYFLLHYLLDRRKTSPTPVSSSN